MFGMYRTFLAFLVVIYHLLSVPVIGNFAVFAFFILSGFLMTTIMHDNYGYNPIGTKKFALKRFLRLYPTYWSVCLITLITILIVGTDYAENYKDTLALKHDFSFYFSNATMMFLAILPYEITPRLVPSAWALTLEIFFYILIALGISKTQTRTKIWLTISVLCIIYSYVAQIEGHFRYASILGASLPFSIGAYLYFNKQKVMTLLKSYKISHPWLLLFIYLLNIILCALNYYYSPFDLSKYIGELGKYINIFLASALIISLYYRGNEIFSKKFDNVIGDYSYPIYLTHWQCGLLASYFLFEKPTRGLSLAGGLSFLLACVLTILTSFFLLKYIDGSLNTHKLKKLVSLTKSN